MAFPNHEMRLAACTHGGNLGLSRLSGDVRSVFPGPSHAGTMVTRPATVLAYSFQPRVSWHHSRLSHTPLNAQLSFFATVHETSWRTPAVRLGLSSHGEGATADRTWTDATTLGRRLWGLSGMNSRVITESGHGTGRTSPPGSNSRKGEDLHIFEARDELRCESAESSDLSYYARRFDGRPVCMEAWKRG